MTLDIHGILNVHLHMSTGGMFYLSLVTVVGMALLSHHYQRWEFWTRGPTRWTSWQEEE